MLTDSRLQAPRAPGCLTELDVADRLDFCWRVTNGLRGLHVDTKLGHKDHPKMGLWMKKTFRWHVETHGTHFSMCIAFMLTDCSIPLRLHTCCHKKLGSTALVLEALELYVGDVLCVSAARISRRFMANAKHLLSQATSSLLRHLYPKNIFRQL